MAYRIRYRVEARRKGQKTYHYLIREFKVSGRKCVIAKYIQAGNAPSKEEITAFLANNIYDIEEEAEQKYLLVRQNTLVSEYLNPATANDIERFRYLYHYLKNLVPEDEMRCYDEEAEFQYIHGTTAIEGNTLTYGETKDLLEHGILPGGKSAREIFEIQNFRNVAEYRKKHTGRITLLFIRNLHKLLMTNILSDPGKFRTSDNVLISGYDYQVTPSLLVEEELEKLIAWYYQKIENGFNPFECAVIFHYRFETIHPFIDGNGRVGRELLNYLLDRAGYPRFIVPGEKRSRYLSALHYGNNDDFHSMLEVFSELMLGQKLDILEKNFRQQLAVRITGSSKKKSLHTLSEFFSYSNFSNNCHR